MKYKYALKFERLAAIAIDGRTQTEEYNDIWHDYRDFIDTYTGLVLSIAIALPIFLLSQIHQFFWGDPIPNVPATVPAPRSLTKK